LRQVTNVPRPRFRQEGPVRGQDRKCRAVDAERGRRTDCTIFGQRSQQGDGMNIVLNPPLLGFIVGTRAALAFGVGLLVADRIPADRRRTVALTLIGIGAATTVPLAMEVLGRRRRPELRSGNA
jgi:hypothetical protein